MLMVKDRVRVVNETNKYFGRVGTVTKVRDDGSVTVSFGGKGRPSIILMTDLQPVVPVEPTA